MSLSESGFERKAKSTRKREFLDEMNLVVPWAGLVSLIAPHAPAPGAKVGRPPFAVPTMLRIHFLQQWFNLSDPAMEEALYDTALFREFAGLDAAHAVCAVQPVDGAAHAAAGDTGMSASECGRRAAERADIGLHTTLQSLKSPPCEIERINSRFGGYCADLP